ncbi:class I SAM-dependent methyltransferase [Trichormus sp. NMC-1]|uniref:class I SAM-dependent methyltransferase n=1 Tax=Trichormus sp. NMC-1 TaxID=1853259 RepID=UPI0008DC1907|nr:class I SAM-dependent methyltransferase [Trichormus sp. NMC-1]
MKHWQDYAKDPNSAEAHLLRTQTLKNAWHEPIEDRIAYLVAAASGKDILDIGVVNHTLESESEPNWLHKNLSHASASCLGIDILAEEVKKLKAAGYNVEICDITKNSLEQKFNLIVAGEVIEHLEDIGAIFRFAKQHLTPEGYLILTTPNPFYFQRIYSFWKNQQNENVDHVCYHFPSGIAELAERNDLALVRYRGVLVPLRTWKGKLIKKLGAKIGLAPEYLCDTIIYECQINSEL